MRGRQVREDLQKGLSTHCGRKDTLCVFQSVCGRFFCFKERSVSGTPQPHPAAGEASAILRAGLLKSLHTGGEPFIVIGHEGSIFFKSSNQEGLRLCQASSKVRNLTLPEILRFLT